MTTRSPDFTPRDLQRVREPAHFGMQLAIAQAARVPGLAFEHDGRLVAALGEMHVQAVPGNVQLAVGEPAEIRRLRVVEGHGERRLPLQLAPRQIRPEAVRVLLRLRVQRLQLRGGHPGTRLQTAPEA